MPCQGLFLLPIASPHSALGRSLPWHSLECRDPARKDSPGHPWLHTHLHTPAAIPERRQLSCPVILTVQQGSPALEHVLPFYTRERSHRLWAVPALGDPSTNCSCIALHAETYHVKGCEVFCSFELSASSHPTLPLNRCLSYMTPLGACRQCPQPCCALQRSCSWAELSLCSAAHLP